MLKLVILAACLYFIFSKVRSSGFTWEVWQFPVNSWLIICLVLLLMPANWLLEAYKWKVSVPHEKISLKKGLEAVLSGLAMNWVVPFTLGDVGGRLAGTKNLKRSSIALIINRTILTLITSIFGALSVLFYFGFFQWWQPFAALVLLVAGLIINKLYVKDDLWNQVTYLSLARYLVFSFQFFLLLSLFLPQVSPLAVSLGVGWVFFFRSFVPSLFGNFGVREASAVLFFEPYITDVSLVIVPSLIIWLINTVIPSVVGAAFIFKLKLNIAQ